MTGSDLYNTEKLQKYWLFFGDYYTGAITLHPKHFTFYVDASNYNPEQLLFQVHRSFLNSRMSNGKEIAISPESLVQDPEQWIFRAIHAVFCQHYWEQTGNNVFISHCETMHANQRRRKTEKPLFSKCGIEYYRIQKRSLKSFAKYPQALDLK